VRIFKTKWFARYARREHIEDWSLREAVIRAEKGLVDAYLGGNVIKQRVARTGQGRSSGYRMLIAFRPKARAVFLYGFAKNERDNIGEDDLATLREIGTAWLAADTGRIEWAITEGALQELKHGQEN